MLACFQAFKVTVKCSWKVFASAEALERLKNANWVTFRQIISNLQVASDFWRPNLRKNMCDLGTDASISSQSLLDFHRTNTDLAIKNCSVYFSSAVAERKMFSWDMGEIVMNLLMWVKSNFSKVPYPTLGRRYKNMKVWCRFTKLFKVKLFKLYRLSIKEVNWAENLCVKCQNKV